MSKCTVLAHVRNSKGEVVESVLFKDLLHHLSDRGLAKEYYAVGTSQEFLDKVRDKAKFDENGEITLPSLISLANIDIPQQRLLATLNRDIKAGSYTYSDAVAKLQSFNRNNSFKDRFIATLKYDETTGKFNLSVVPRNANEEAKLQKEISNRSIQERIMYYLNKAGVSVEFIEQDDKKGGRYSTINAEKTADGLYSLIKIAKGEDVTAALAEEAGHFAVGALGNSPLVKRLMELLTPEVQKRILGDEYSEKELGLNSRREVAGSLVGRALRQEIDRKAPWQRLAYRIADLAKRIFHTIKGDEVYNAVSEAKKIADQIAGGFMSSNFDGNVETALETKETLYSAKQSLNKRVFREVVNRLNLATSRLKAIDNNLFATKLQAILGDVEAGRTTALANQGLMADLMALDGIAVAIDNIADMIGPGKEVNNLLDSVDFDNDAEFFSNMPTYAKKLRQVSIFLQNSIALQQLIKDMITPVRGKETLTGDVHNVQITDSLGRVVNVNLEQVLRTLADANSNLHDQLISRQKQFFARFCEDSLGAKYVRMSAKVVFNPKHKTTEGRKGTWLDFRRAKEVTIGDALNSLESDISLFERYLGSMSNNSDIIGQIADKVTKASNKIADDLTNQCWDQLRILQDRLKKMGFSTSDMSFLYERSARTGELTGNIMSDVNWGDYESDYKEFKDTEFENFKNSLPNWDSMTEFEKGVQWDAYFRPKVKAWHKIHSTYDQLRGRYIPNDTYANPEFQALMQQHNGLRGWYNDYMQLKADLDSRLPEGSTLEVRLPQFKGTFMNRMRNASLTEGRGKAFGHALRGSIMETFCESSEDTDYGSNNTYNSEDEEKFGNALAYEKEKINRLPLFGINKLQDMSELSTNLMQSTLAYAGMANSYAALSQIVDVFEVGTEVLSRRAVKGLMSEQEKAGDKSRAFNRYVKFLDKQVYGISSTKHKIGKKIIFEKIISALSSFGGKYFLAGNVAGGMVNTMTGFNEIFKEAISGEYFDVKDFTRANKLYFSGFVDNWLDYGSNNTDNKTALFIRYFNILGDNRQEQREWGRHSRIYNMFSKSLMLPYKSGDHYMQSISYLAVASKIKLYDENGLQVPMYNAYHVVDNVDSYGRKKGKTIELKGTFFKGKESKAEYDMIQSILGQMQGASSGPFGPTINLSQDEADYLASKGLSLADTDNTIRALEEAAYKLTWTVDDENQFMDKCREINNRLHGIYNNQDKTAFHGTWYGNAVLAMRGWAIGNAERIFAPSHYSLALGREVEGTLNTVAKAMAYAFTDRAGWKLTMRAILLPFGKNSAKMMYSAGFSTNQIRNMRRNWADFLWLGMLGLICGLTSAGDDDDDESEVAKGVMYYFAHRLYREQEALRLPTGWIVEKNSLLDLTPAGVAAATDLTKFVYQFGGAMVANEDDPDFYYQGKKEGRYEKGDPKWVNHMMRMTPFLRSTYVFTHPYEAQKSYEYGRNIKSR